MKPLEPYSGAFNPMDFITALYQATTLDEAFAAYDQQMQKLGFEGALYAFIPRLHLEAKLGFVPLVKVAKSRNPAFMEHYQLAGLEQHDFTLHGIIQGRVDPIDWWGEERKGVLTPAERHLICLAKEDYGIMNGISLGMMHGEMGVAGVSVVSSEPNRLYSKLLHENFAAFQMCSGIFHAHVMDKVCLRHFFLEPFLDLLNDKEKKLLAFVVTGRPMKQVSNYLPGVSQKYAENLLDGIRTKFGGINKSRLIYYAGLLRLLDHF